jgi:hypothetical protein
MWTYIGGIKRSVIAFFVVAALGLFSMGFLGALLYYVVFFALPASFPDIDNVGGDWVWPATIGVGMAWSFGFLFAGAFDRYVETRLTNSMLRKAIYGTVLWIWALALWWLAYASR